jgi:ribosomal protein L35AE/L33A
MKRRRPLLGVESNRTDLRSARRSAHRFVAFALPVLLLAGLVTATIAPPARALAVRTKLPSISVNNVKVQEGDSGTSRLVFTVRLSKPSSARVHYRVSGDTATKADFKAVHGSLRFNRNTATRKITVKVIGDALHESDETLTLTLANAKRARIADGVGRGTILDDDVLGGSGPALSIGDFTVTEGNLGITEALFDVTLSSSSSTPISVDFATVNGSAVFASDYDPAGGTLTFAPGETSKQVVVKVTGDTTAEANEKFSVNLTNAIGATIADAIGLGTITDDDSGGPAPNPSLVIANATVTEGNSGTVNAAFTVTLSAPSSNAVTVNWITANGSATAPADYGADNGTLTFNPGETSQQIVVLVQGDTVSEANETFSVNLSSATNATIADNSGLGTITDNDTSTITIGASTVTEGNSGTVNAAFNVSLSAPTSGTVTVDWATANGSATANGDYIGDNGTVTFNPGEVSQQIVVQVVGDIAVEPNETFSVNLSNPTNATIVGSGFALGTITDNDTPTITIVGVAVTEGNSGTVNAVFNVTLSAVSGNGSAVGSPPPPGDYISQSGTVTFLPGETAKQIVIQVVGDVIIEANETFSVNLSNPTNATIAGSGFGTGTINSEPTG